MVWGMPGEAVAIGAATDVLPLPEIPTRILAVSDEMDITRRASKA
jgi:chemotaxis response regulator CheB